MKVIETRFEKHRNVSCSPNAAFILQVCSLSELERELQLEFITKQDQTYKRDDILEKLSTTQLLLAKIKEGEMTKNITQLQLSGTPAPALCPG